MYKKEKKNFNNLICIKNLLHSLNTLLGPKWFNMNFRLKKKKKEKQWRKTPSYNIGKEKNAGR